MQNRLFSTGSRRDNGDNKPPLSKLPFAALNEVARVHQYGDDHYGIGNWRKGQPISVLMDSMLRHASQFMRGHNKDKSSGLYHVAHMAWNALVILHQVITGRTELDDRINDKGEWVSSDFASTELATTLAAGKCHVYEAKEHSELELQCEDPSVGHRDELGAETRPDAPALHRL